MSRWTADSRWYRKARRAFLAANPVCRHCGHAGADQIDHIIPASIAPEFGQDPANWWPAHGVNGCPICLRKCNQERGVNLQLKPSRHSRNW